ncbi:MAG: ribosome-associated translation inhibitor RaiA [Phycisphaerae bacterium]|nr:ribosome-associated translation inhibitor RaiA [Phycisphaerae bacterium]
MNIRINTRHMEASAALREYAESKVQKLPKYFDGVQSVEVIMEMEAGQSKAEVVVQASRKTTFVAHHRAEDMYACIDQCMDKVSEQIRRYKDKLRNHKTHAPSTGGLE